MVLIPLPYIPLPVLLAALALYGSQLDAGELAKLANEKANLRRSWNLPANENSSLTALRCPRCSDSRLVEVHIEDRAFLGCRGCDGLFISSDTLDTITVTDDEEGQNSPLGGIASAFDILDALGTVLDAFLSHA